MELFAYDKDFNLVTVAIPYDNLQWTRRYYEAGEFEVQVSLKHYDPKWAYMELSGRTEIGMIQKIQISGELDTKVLLSGYFAEKMLDDRVCYPRYIHGTDSTINIMSKIFERYGEDLPITWHYTFSTGEQFSLGETTCDFSDDQLGQKLYSIAEAHGGSIRVFHKDSEYFGTHLYVEAWAGKNRTQSQDKNSYQVFSSNFANIIDKTIDIDDSGYKNYAIIPVNADDNGKEQDTYWIDATEGGEKKMIVFDMRSYKPAEDQMMHDFRNAVLDEAAQRLLSYAKVEEIDIVPANDVGYMVDYDLGDVCDVILEDIGITIETRIVEVVEVFKAEGGHELTIGLGNRRIDNIRRAVNTI